MPFSQIIPPLPSPTESKSLFLTSVSFSARVFQSPHCRGVIFTFVLMGFLSVFQLGKETQTYTFTISQSVLVTNLKPATIKVYDYYLPGEGQYLPASPDIFLPPSS